MRKYAILAQVCCVTNRSLAQGVFVWCGRSLIFALRIVLCSWLTQVDVQNLQTFGCRKLANLRREKDRSAEKFAVDVKD